MDSEQRLAVDRLFAAGDQPGSPGCALAVTRDGQIVHQRGYGLANLEYGVPMTPTTTLHVASLSKQVTALAILLLAQEQRLSLGDDIRRYVPEVPAFGPVITLRHLLHHTSGLRDQWELTLLSGTRLEDVITTADILAIVERQEALNFTPGSEYSYCNTGYTLLGLVIERISGQSLNEFCVAHLFAPLSMAHTHFHDEHGEIVPGRAYSYALNPEGAFCNSVLSYATAGATSLFSTAEDLARWVHNLDEGTVGGPDVVRELRIPGRLNDGQPIAYAMGLVAGSYRGLPILEHGGVDAGFRAHLLFFPGQRTGIIILGNVATLRPHLLARRVADIVLAQGFPEPPALAVPPEDSVRLSEQQLGRLAGLYRHTPTGTTRRLEVREGRLVDVTETPHALVPMDENCFRRADRPESAYQFLGLSDGIRQLWFAGEAERPLIYQAVAEAHPSLKELATYSGDYWSRELDITFHLALDGDQLVMRARKLGCLRLHPTDADGFVIRPDGGGPFADIRFVREPEGRVVAFSLSTPTGRARHIRFVRQADQADMTWLQSKTP